jgi:hypothetical protein
VLPHGHTPLRGNSWLLPRRTFIVSNGKEEGRGNSELMAQSSQQDFLLSTQENNSWALSSHELPRSGVCLCSQS